MLATLYTRTYIYIAIQKSQGKGKGKAEVRNIPCMSWPLWERISIPQRKIFQVEFLQQVLDIQRYAGQSSPKKYKVVLILKILQTH